MSIMVVIGINIMGLIIVSKSPAARAARTSLFLVTHHLDERTDQQARRRRELHKRVDTTPRK